MGPAAADVVALLNGHFPEETDILGAATTRTLAEASLDGRDPHSLFRAAKGGYDTDPGGTLAILIQVATLVQLGITIWRSARATGTKPSEDEFVQHAISQTKPETIKAVGEQIRALIKDLYSMLSQQS